MTDARRPTSSRAAKPRDQKKKQHNFRCTEAEWAAIVRAAAKVSYETGERVTPSKWIRSVLLREIMQMRRR